MKVLIFNTLYYPNSIGGAEKSVQLLAESLKEKGINPVIVCTDKVEREDYVNGVKVYYIKNKNLYWFDQEQKNNIQKSLWHALDNYNYFIKKKITWIINQEKPQIIHTNNITGFSMMPWILAKENKLPLIHTLRDYSLMCSKTTMFKNGENCDFPCKECKLFNFYKQKLSNENHVDHLVGISQFIINKFKDNDYFQGVPSTRIFNGMELSNRSKINPEFNSFDRKIKFLYMGRIEKAKGINKILEEISEIKDVELYIAGKVKDDEIKRNIQEGKYPTNIKFLGFINPKEIIPKIDVMLVPSLWHEPFGRVIIEAYSYGKTVIGTNLGGIPELIVQGQTGFIYNPKESDSLKNIIKGIISNPDLLKSISNNLNGFITKFDSELIASKYIEVYKGVIDKKAIKN
ncbi:glycosyltransferase family 4 protein [Metabacillus sp. FJAT-53654]|uniref:Glycosyltransferase family 4 protein n=1 Tax=Metabacillus rhizosphaerae TaxID=3117747 RepID=A0ABZ2MWE0_9BACI